MSGKTRQTLTLADRMREAGVDPIWVDQVQTLVLGYGSQRTTNSLLWKDNMELRRLIAKLAPETVAAAADDT